MYIISYRYHRYFLLQSMTNKKKTFEDGRPRKMGPKIDQITEWFIVSKFKNAEPP